MLSFVEVQIEGWETVGASAAVWKTMKMHGCRIVRRAVSFPDNGTIVVPCFSSATPEGGFGNIGGNDFRPRYPRCQRKKRLRLGRKTLMIHNWSPYIPTGSIRVTGWCTCQVAWLNPNHNWVTGKWRMENSWFNEAGGQEFSTACRRFNCFTPWKSRWKQHRTT